MASKNKEPSQKTLNYNLMKNKALEKIVEHNRDYLKLDVTIPLGNPALKQVHTNQWLWTNLPKEFDLANWTIIAKALNSNTNRYEGYVKNRWYIESCDINVSADGKAEMKLGLNAFASSYKSFTDGMRSMQKAYNDAVNKNKETTKSSAAKNTSNAVAVGDNPTVKNGWWGKWVTDWVKKTVGAETDQLKKAKLIDKGFKSVTHWSDYSDPQKTWGNVNNYEKVFNGHYMNCADGANILCAFHNCAGIKSTIMHTTGHYIVRMTINGTYYWTDCSAANGQLCNKAFNEVYGYKGGSDCGTRLTMD